MGQCRSLGAVGGQSKIASVQPEQGEMSSQTDTAGGALRDPWGPQVSGRS